MSASAGIVSNTDGQLLHDERTGKEPSGKRCLSALSVGGIRQSVVTLISTAVGSGVLSVSYALALSGFCLGNLLLLAGALVAYLSTVALMEICASTGKRSYAEVFAHCAGSWAQPCLDVMLFVYGNGCCVGYLVFVGDFLPPIISLTAAPALASSRAFCIALGALLIAPLCVQRNLRLLRYFAPLPLIALAYITCVVVAKAPKHFWSLENSDLPLFNMTLEVPEAFAICVFAYNGHLNVVPVAANLVRPTESRIKKVGMRVIVVQVSFYVVVAVAGYLTFLDETPQDILTGYAASDVLAAVGRAVLSVTILVARIPANFVPTMKSGLQFAATLWSRRGASDTALLEGGQMPAEPEERACVRVMLGLIFLLLQTLTAIQVPGVAFVISLLGGTIATAMIMVIPAYCMRAALPRTLGNCLRQMFLLAFACLAFASVPINILRMTGVLAQV